MKNKVFLIVKHSIAILLLCLLILSLILPAISLSYQGSSQKVDVYLIEILSGINLGTSSSDTVFSIGFYGVISVALLIISFGLSTLSNKKTCKVIGLVLQTSFLLYLISLISKINLSEESIVSSLISFSKAGFYFSFVIIILNILVSFIFLFEDNICELVTKYRNVTHKSKEEELLELKSLFEKDLISQEIFEEKRKEIINR